MSRDLLRKARIVCEHMKNNVYSPFTLRSKLDRGKSYSDFFVYGAGFHSIIFIAENIYSMTLYEPLLVRHIFTFYDARGTEIHKYVLESAEPFTRVVLPSLPLSDQYISFTHHVQPEQHGSSEVQKRFIAKVQESRGIQHRGYVIYKVNNLSIGSTVHGNFGGITYCEEEPICAAAIKRKTYRFTSSYVFSSDDQYDLVLNNPTKSSQVIILSGHEQNGINKLEIPLNPLGTKSLRIDGYEGTLTLISSMPLCRPIIFKKPESKSGFDVFHP